MQNWLYLAVTGLAFLIVVLFRQVLTSGSKSLFIFDSIGLALFVVIGIQKTIFAGYPMWVAIVMGIITGSFGGVVRDILINVEPLFFAKIFTRQPVWPEVLFTGQSCSLAETLSCNNRLVPL